MYWAIPIPRANGRKAWSRSPVRQDSTIVSSVTTIAEQSVASARRTKLSTTVPSLLQYSWNQRSWSPSSGTMSSIGCEACEEMIIGTSVARAALATARSPAGCASSSTPIGAAR